MKEIIKYILENDIRISIRHDTVFFSFNIDELTEEERNQLLEKQANQDRGILNSAANRKISDKYEEANKDLQQQRKEIYDKRVNGKLGTL